MSANWRGCAVSGRSDCRGRIVTPRQTGLSGWLSLEGIVSKRADTPTRPAIAAFAQSQMPQPRGVCGGRLDISRRLPALARGAVAGLLRPERPSRLRWPGGGINDAELGRLWRRLQPLATRDMPLDLPPPRTNRFGSPLVLSRVHWMRPELVAEVKYLTGTDENLLRQVVYEGLREDEPSTEVRRPVQHPKPLAEACPTLSTKTAQLEATNTRHSR